MVLLKNMEKLILRFMDVCMLTHSSCVQFFVTLWTVTRQAPLSMELSGQEYRSGLPIPPPGDLPDPGIKPVSLMSPALVGRFFTTEPPGKPSFPSSTLKVHILMHIYGIWKSDTGEPLCSAGIEMQT